jgi:hypothetical protein
MNGRVAACIVRAFMASSQCNTVNTQRVRAFLTLTDWNWARGCQEMNRRIGVIDGD